MEFLEIGKIVNTLGLKGELKIMPTTDDPSRFGLLKTVHMSLNGVNSEVTIETARQHKQFVILKLAGVDDINLAEKYKGGSLRIPREQSLPLAEGEYYIGDLIGMEVLSDGGELLGVIEDVLFTGANDVYVVRNAETKKELLIPAIKQCILDVDATNKKMTVHLLEGLR